MANFANVSACYPGDLDESDCYPCNPCGPDTSCNPRGSSDEDMDCYPCHPCNPDTDSRCYPCSPCSPDTRDDDSSSGSGSGCFITSACTETLGLPDNCDELQTLRVLRDKRILYDDSFGKLVKEYYSIAPRIVSVIDGKLDRRAIYEQIYRTLVKPCTDLVKVNKENEAVERYSSIVMQLKEQYLEEA